jgi:dihydroxycyclohexadiene carboxylate dehydrogenase
MTGTAAQRYQGRVVVVTGAAQGIGRACALRMAAEGARVVLVDRATGPCEAVRDQIRTEGGEALLVAADLEQHEGAQAVVQAALQAHGRVDVSVHNVGGTIWAKPFWEYTPDEMQREISRSLWPTLWCCREMAALMKRQGDGAIVNVGSIATRGIYRVPYAAAKGGVHAMTVAMAMELAEFGVRVNCVSPGAIDNGQRIVPRNPQPLSEAETGWMQAIYTQSLRDTPMNRLGTPEEIAAAIGFLGAPEASYITGQVLFVGGGAIG